MRRDISSDPHQEIWLSDPEKSWQIGQVKGPNALRATCSRRFQLLEGSNSRTVLVGEDDKEGDS